MADVYKWNDEKDLWLQKHRGLSFDMVENAVEQAAVVDDVPHPNPARAHQRILVILCFGRHVAVPYVRNGTTRFLKTMYFSRDLDAKYGVEDGKADH